MQHYTVTQKKLCGIYTRGDTVYFRIEIKDILTSQLSDPSDVSISITEPGGLPWIVADPMTHISTGVYDYEVLIPDILTVYQFGIFDVVISTATEDSLTHMNFVVFPWDITSRVRVVSGSLQQNDMSDYNLNQIAWLAYMETLETIYEKHLNEKPLCDCVTGLYIDGTNKTFQTKCYPIADHNGDEQVTGYGEIALGHDITGYWLDSSGNKAMCKISVSDAVIGKLTIETLAGLAIPASAQGIYITYYIESPSYDLKLMREAVAYLTSYKVAMAFKSLDKATLADLQSNRDMLYQRFLLRYEQIVDEIGFPNIGCGK